MKILAVSNDAQAVRQLADCLCVVFPQNAVLEYRDPLLAVKYCMNHPEEIELVFTEILLEPMDGFQMAECIQQVVPNGVTIFYTVQSEDRELLSLVRLRGGAACIPKPVTDEKIRKAVEGLSSPYLV